VGRLWSQVGKCPTLLLTGTLFAMGVTLSILGDKGRLVVPRDLRLRHNWAQGSTLVFTELDDGEVRLQSADAALAQFRASVVGTPSPVDELLAERHREAVVER